jgi:phage shock protein A
MVKAIGRWIKAVGYLLTGQIDAARRILDTNPHVVRAKYDEIIREKTSRIQQYMQAVAGLITQQEHKVSTIKELTKDVEKLERLKAGALAQAKQQVEKLKKTGMDPARVKEDDDYKKCLAAYNDFSSTLAEKQARIEELERDVEGYAKSIGDHKVQLQHLVRDIEQIKAEAHEAVADMITAKQEKDIADTLSGIAEDGSAQELQRMRELRREVRAEARISKELAGTDARAQEAEFLEYARSSVASNEFDALVGLAEKADAGPQVEAAPETKTPLPE